MAYNKQVTALEKYCLEYFYHSMVNDKYALRGYVFISGVKDGNEFKVKIPLLSIFKKMDDKRSYHEFIQDSVDKYISDVASIYDEFYEE